MNIKVLKQVEGRIEVKLTGVSIEYANALRRFIISEVPTMAIDDVVIIENDSIVYDELVSHRLGLVPLKTDLNRYVLPEKCDCDTDLGCSKCRVLLVLNAEAKKDILVVNSGDLVSEDDFVKPVSDSIPILKLAPGQKIKLEAYAKLGRGRDHSKWQPTSASVLKAVDKSDEQFILIIESVGSLSASEIFLKSIEILRDKLNVFIEETGDLKKN